MKISFIIPAYNEVGYINLCLDALIREIDTQEARERSNGNAGDRDYEIIVVDNNSNDDTCDTVTQYSAKHPFISLIHEPRRGANRARETGFEASHGDLIAFLDADTEILPDWLPRVEKEFADNKELVCVSGPFIYYDLPIMVRALVKIFYGISYLVYLFNTVIVRNTSVIQGGTEVVRRNALKAIGGHNVDLTFYGDDADLALRLSKVGKVVFSFRFSMRSSGRRLAKEGAFTMGLRYGLNYFWVTLFNKPFTITSKEVRLNNKSKKDSIYHPENRRREWVIAAFVLLIFLTLACAIGWLAVLIIRLKIW